MAPSSSSLTSLRLIWLRSIREPDKNYIIVMKIVIVLLAIGAASAGRLENVYLPAGTAGSAGGAGFIKAPGFGAGGAGTGGASSGGYYSGNQAAYQGGAGQHGQFIEITRYNNDNNGDGSYQYNYETANGISVEESGALQGDGEAVRGSYSYTGPDGAQYTVHYTADENGFHPEGAHLPTPPPIPEEIRRGVELSLAAEARGENQDGQYRAEPQGNYNRYQAPSTGNSGYRY